MGVSGLTGLKIGRREPAGLLDWNDLTFKTSAWGAVSTTLTEVDTVNQQGLYRKTVEIGDWPDGKYYLLLDYSGSPEQHTGIEFIIEGGRVLGDYIVSKLDINVASRFAAASYTAPDNAGIAALPLLSEMLAGGVAKESTLATAQTDITSVLNYAIAMSKWKNNKLARTVAGTTETWVLYDDDSTTPMLTWTNNISTRVRTKAT